MKIRISYLSQVYESDVQVWYSSWAHSHMCHQLVAHCALAGGHGLSWDGSVLLYASVPSPSRPMSPLWWQVSEKESRNTQAYLDTQLVSSLSRWSEQVTWPELAFVWEDTGKDEDTGAGKAGAVSVTDSSTAPHY